MLIRVTERTGVRALTPIGQIFIVLDSGGAALPNPDGFFLLGLTFQGGKNEHETTLCNKMAIVVHAMIMFRVMCERITTGPDLVWDQKAFLCGSDVPTEI